MQWYNVMMLLMIAITALVAWNTPRARLWCLCIAAAYVGPLAYLRSGLAGSGYFPPQEFVNIIFDGTVFLIVREFHGRQWEHRSLETILVLIVTADILQLYGVLVGYPPPLASADYGIILEILGLMALALIFGMGLMDRLHAHGYSVAGSRNSFLRWVSDCAHAKSTAKKPLRKW